MHTIHTRGRAPPFPPCICSPTCDPHHAGLAAKHPCVAASGCPCMGTRSCLPCKQLTSRPFQDSIIPSRRPSTVASQHKGGNVTAASTGPTANPPPPPHTHNRCPDSTKHGAQCKGRQLTRGAVGDFQVGSGFRPQPLTQQGSVLCAVGDYMLRRASRAGGRPLFAAAGAGGRGGSLAFSESVISICSRSSALRTSVCIGLLSSMVYLRQWSCRAPDGTSAPGQRIVVR